MSIDAPGVIEPGVFYLADEARRRLKVGEWGWRKMRRAGLKVVRLGKRSYVFGDDLLSFFTAIKDQQAGVVGQD